MNADGSDSRQLTGDRVTDVLNFTWSPDGKRIAYEAHGFLSVIDVQGRVR